MSSETAPSSPVPFLFRRLLERLSQVRRVYADGRAWAESPPGSSVGYSIGRWLDQTGTGRFDSHLRYFDQAGR